MNKIIVTLIVLLIELVYCERQYGDESLYYCNAAEDPIQDESAQSHQQKEALILFPVDRWVFMILSPFTMIGAGRIMYEFFKDRKLFGIPGDIIFVITLTNGIQAICQFSTALYVTIKKAPPSGYFCDVRSLISQITGVAASIVFAVSNLYIFVFSAYPLSLIYNALESTTKMLRIFNYTFMSFVTILIIAGALIQDQIVSVTLNGVCAISATKSKTWDYIIALIILFVFLLFAIMSILFIFTFKKLVPKMQGIRQLRGHFLRYYQRFVLFSIIMKLLLGISSAINLLNCYIFLDPYLTVAETCQNVCQSICILGQIYIITYDPLLRTKFNRQAITESDKTSTELNTSQSNSQELVQQPNVYNMLHQRMKKIQVYSMLAGIVMITKLKLDEAIKYKDSITSDDAQENDKSNSHGDLSELMETTIKPFSTEETEECLILSLRDESVKQSIQTIPDMEVFQMRCIMYAPKIFHYFQILDNIDFEDCFDLKKNASKIEQFGGPDGGKSGEFFFFSHNNQLIIKTMRQQEVYAYKKRLYNFSTYLVNNSQSLLAKIYGMYTFERMEEKNSKVHFLIMKNLSLGIPRNSILRTYDMKGSEFDRQVLTEKFEESDLSKMTLKDLDFQKIEKQINVELLIKKKLNEKLQFDSKFLESQKLIDYSLLVMIIDWTGKEDEIMKHIDGSQINIVRSNIEQGSVFYHIAIIDYLQQWNVNKNMERTTKKILKMNLSLDTSAQEPHIYGKRFREKLIQKILPIP